MRFDLEKVGTGIGYKLLTATVTPRPIAWVTTVSAAGGVNAAPFSFFNVMGPNPPTLVLGLMRDPKRGFKDTARNILETGEFVVNLVSEPLAEAMNLTSVDAPPEVDELDLAGLARAPAHHIRPPLIADAPVSLECRMLSSVVTGPQQTIVIGRILAVHVTDDCVTDAARGHIDSPKLGLIARTHGAGWYARSSDQFRLDRPDWPPTDG